MKRAWFAVTMMIAFLLLGTAAFAVDGTVLINQNTAVNGLPGCGSSGFPIVICQSGSYKLAGNLNVPAGVDGIDINATDVTVDLNGFTIAGPWTSVDTANSTFGVSANNGNIRISNGTIHGFTIGVRTYTADNAGNSAAVDHLTVSGTRTAVVVDNASVSFVHAYNNSFNGIDVVGSGTVLNCHADHNAWSGISITGSYQVSTNAVSANSHAGIFVDNYGPGTALVNNTVVNNTYGLELISNGAGGKVAAYGANTMLGNTTDIYGLGGASMGNNMCTSGPC